METPPEYRATAAPSLFEHVVTGFSTLLVLEQHSRLPEANFFVVIFCSIATLCLGIAYLARLAKPSQRDKTVPANNRSPILDWAGFPLALALMFSSAATHWPATIRFNLSKSSFDELVAQAHNGEEPQGFPRRVGLYWINYVKDDDFDYETCQGTIGFVTGTALIDECGLYYDKANPQSSHYLTTRIAPHWYVTEW